MGKSVQKHERLGQLHWDANCKSWSCKLKLRDGCAIEFVMIVEAEWVQTDPNLIFEIGAEYLEWAEKAEANCRERVADDLLEVYNRSWARESKIGLLSREQFIAKLTLSSITLYHNTSADWMYDCGPLFAGHAIDFLLDPDKNFVGKAGLFG